MSRSSVGGITSNRGASVFDEVEGNLDKMWNNFYDNKKVVDTPPQKQQQYDSSYDELFEQRLELQKAQAEVNKKKKKKRDFTMNSKALNVKKERKWLCNRGRAHRLGFSDAQLIQLRDCFDSLDDDGGGSIGIEELQEPLIGLGFADTLEQVQELVDAVDEDKSGCIEFDEFIGIIKNSGKNKSTQDITEFFEKLTTGGFDM